MAISSDIAAFSNPYGAPSQGEWNLSRGVYTNSKGISSVFFFEVKDSNVAQKTAIDTISDSGGRRLAVYEYPYVDGQAIDDLGQKGETYTFNIKFFGSDYQSKFAEFKNNVINDKGTGTLLHPVLSAIQSNKSGGLSVRFRDYEVVHRYDEWQSVTIKATFVQDFTGTIAAQNQTVSTPNSVLRSALQTLVSTQAAISQAISDVSAALLLPSAINAALNARLTSIIEQVSGLLGQLGATFSNNAQIQALASAASSLGTSMTSLTSGTVSTNGTLSQLPAVYQVGFDPTTQTAIATQIANFVNANTITPQQAVYSANSARSTIATAINEINTNMGNYGYDIVLSYKQLAVSIQTTTEVCVSSQQPQVIIYTTPRPMSLRKICQLNNLSADRQNDIENLNPYLTSVNYVPAGVQVTVPAS